jgi:catechol 2,3-dioxygenase-like lactoylglutathione lyase family enzyme
MKRFHVNVAVADLDRSVEFYSTLFGTGPTVLKPDYARWLLEDPRINFSLSESGHRRGINHLGLQAESESEVLDLRKRLHQAGLETSDQANAECCYAKATKTWVRDPDDVAWESFVTHEDLPHYGQEVTDDVAEGSAERCCATQSAAGCCLQ